MREVEGSQLDLDLSALSVLAGGLGTHWASSFSWTSSVVQLVSYLG